MRRIALPLAVVFTLTFAPLAGAQVSADEPAPAGADPAKVARERYNAGLQAYQSRRYREAALHFEAASHAVPSAIALYTAGTAWELSDQPERAADDFARCVQLPNLPADKAQSAKERLAALEALLGRVEVTAPEGWRVQLDSNTEVPAPAVLHGSAGVHTVTVRAPDKPIDRRSVSLVIGQATKLDLTAPPPEPKKEPEKPATPPPASESKPAPPPPAPPNVRRTIGFVALGFGGAALASGVVLGLQANDARDAYVAKPSQQGYDHASSLQTWTNLALIGGGVVAVGGLALVFWPTSKPAAPVEHDREKDKPEEPQTSLVLSPTLGGAVLRGTF